MFNYFSSKCSSFKALLAAFCLLSLIACSPNTENGNSQAQEAEDAVAVNPGYRRINSPNPADSLNAAIFELDNGLRVYLSENHEEPRFYAEIAVRAGSKHDPADGTGLAHYLEHLLFKGSQQFGTLDYAAEKPYLDEIVALYERHHDETDLTIRAEIYAEINAVAQQAAEFAVPGEYDKTYGAMGATNINAHTSYEETVYKVGLPSNRLEQWAEIESDRFMNPVFRLFHTELETVYEEKNRSMDSSGRAVSEAIDDMLYKTHPYGQQPTIGTTEHLKNPSLVYIQNYFDENYVPNNMGIFISGDINIDETIALISEKFSQWQSKPVPEVGPWVEAPIQGVERRTVQFPGEEQVQLAFRTVAQDSEEAEALQILDMILDNRTAGLINLNLSQQQRVASAGSFPHLLNDAGSQQLWGTPRQGQTLEEVEALLLEQIELIKAGEFEDWIIPAIVNDFAKSQKASMESNTARTSQMTQSFLSYADWDDQIAELDRFAQVTKQDVVDVANKYFGEDYIAVYRIDAQNELPPVEKPLIDPVSIDPSRQSDFAANVLSMPYEEIEPSFVEIDTDYKLVDYVEGVPLYYAPNPLNDLFSFSINIDVGSVEDKELGLASALVDKAGTTRVTNEELQKEWYQLGSDFRFSAGGNQSVFAISGLDDQFEPTLDLMLELINNPTADEETLQALKGIILKSNQDQKSSPPAIAQALYLYNRYGDESPLLEALSTQEIQDAELSDLLALPANLLNYKHTITYTGSMALEDLLATLREHYTPNENLLDTPDYRFRTAREIDATQIYVVNRETAQSQVRIEFSDGQYSEDIALAASIYNSYFGSGMSSVVFQELREARALAYSAAASYAQGNRLNDENLMLGVIGSQTDKTVDALAAFLDLIDNMPASPERFDIATGSLLNRYRTSKVSFRQVINRVRGWERLGLDGDPGRERFAALQSESMENLLFFQQEHVQGRPKLISIVGDTSIIDMEELAQFGSVTEVQVDQLFAE